MTTKPVLSQFNILAEIMIQKYERYLPTAFDESMSLLEKVNKVVEYLNQVGKLNNDLITQWNTVMEWIMNDGLNESIQEKLDEMTTNGSLETLINQNVFGDLNNQLKDIVQVNVKKYGAKGDGVTDDTQAIVSALTYAKANLPCTVYFPKGTYLYVDLGDLAYEGLSIKGAGDKVSILKCISTSVNHNAISLNGFRFGTTSDQFVMRCNWKDIQVQGNLNTANIFFLQGVAMMNWENVTGAVADATSGKMLHLKSVHLSSFKNVSVSANLNNITPLPYYGLYMDEGARGGNLAGNSTNNTFTNCYFESVNTGAHLVKADQNIFIGGAMEGCSNIGLKIDPACKWNKFMGVGFEKNASLTEAIDNGRLTQFDACYFDKKLELQGQSCKVSGCSCGSLVLTATSVYNDIENVRVNYHGSNDGGFVDNGGNNKYKNINDMFTGSWFDKPVIYENRSSLTVGSSPFKWKNNTGKYVNVIAQSGTLTNVFGFRNGSSYLLPVTIPNHYILAPNDEIEFTYSVAPSVSYVPLNGLV